MYRPLLLSLLTIIVLSGCGAVNLIFKAGMWWAFFLIGVVIVLLAVAYSKFRRK